MNRPLTDSKINNFVQWINEREIEPLSGSKFLAEILVLSDQKTVEVIHRMSPPKNVWCVIHYRYETDSDNLNEYADGGRIPYTFEPVFVEEDERVFETQIDKELSGLFYNENGNPIH